LLIVLFKPALLFAANTPYGSRLRTPFDNPAPARH
jgi:hypothetical protein